MIHRTRLGDRWIALIQSPGLGFPCAILALNFALTLVTEFAVFRNVPHSGDEYAYYVSAELFSRGKLSVPSPPLREFFDVDHVLNDGKFTGKYPPGWPVLLAVGAFFRVPWLVNPVLGTLTLGLLHHLARKHFSPKVARISLIAAAANPYFVFTSASYFSHSACLLASTAFLYFVLECRARPDDGKAFLGLGLSAGAALTIRPFTAAALILPGACFLIVQAFRSSPRAQWFRGLAVAAVPFAVCLALFLAYNKAQTGDAFLQPFEQYDRSDRPRLPSGAEEWGGRLGTHFLDRLWELNRWLPLSVVFLVLAWGLPEVRGSANLWICQASFWALLVAYGWYWGTGVVQYGPRYLYEALGAVLILCGVVVSSFGRWGGLVALGMLLLNVSMFVAEAQVASRHSAEILEVHDLAKEMRLTQSIVFAQKRTIAPLWGAPGSVIDFSADILIVKDRGVENRLLLERHPGRKGFLYGSDSGGRGRLVPH
jgi:hypothetical protein